MIDSSTVVLDRIPMSKSLHTSIHPSLPLSLQSIHFLSSDSDEFILPDISPDFHSLTGFAKSKCLKLSNRCSFKRVTITHCELSKTPSEKNPDV